LQKEYERVFGTISFEYQQLLDKLNEAVKEPHIKRELRMNAWDDLITGVCKGLSVGSQVWLQKAWVKFKSDEWAKPRKVGRVIGDLGVAASLQAFVITKMMKETLNGKRLQLHNDGEYMFIATPRPEELGPIFRELLTTGSFLFIGFSDDGAFGYRDENGVVYTFNVDISKCDRSHTAEAFAALVRMVPKACRVEIENAVAQLVGWNTVRSTLKSDREKCYFRHRDGHAILLSGSTLTTILNTVQLGRIAYCISALRRSDLNPQKIRIAAALAGYSISVEVNTQAEDLQFLKHSPCLVNGQYEALLNVGVLLRASGITKGDYLGPKTQPILERAADFQHLLVQGCYPNHQFRLRALLQPESKTPVTDRAVKNLMKHLPFAYAEMCTDSDFTTVLTQTRMPIHIDDEDILRRYRLLPHEYTQLLSEPFLVGHSYSSSAVHKILMKDYQLGSRAGIRVLHPTDQLPLIYR
jgi:hypothetical protein